MLQNYLNPQKLKSLFNPAFYERGKNYYFEGRVEDIQFQRKSKSLQIRSRVDGNKKYQVVIEISGSPNKPNVRGICTCPMQINCKHVVATLLEAFDEEALNPNIHAIDPAPALQQDPQVMTWLNQLKNAVNITPLPQQAVDESHCLFYLLELHPYQPQELRLSLQLVRRLKAGGFGASKTYNHLSYSHQKHLYPEDKELVARLEVLKRVSSTGYDYHSDSYRLGGENAETVLKDLLATQRCCWQSAKNPPLSLGDAKKASPVWQLEENGYQVLQYQTDERFYTPFIIHNTWYLDEKTWQLGLLETGLENHIANILIKSPKIPPDQANDVKSFLASNEKTKSLAQPIIFKQSKTEKHKPIPCLRLFTGDVYLPNDYSAYQRPSQEKLALASLSFNYNGALIPWHEQKRSVQLIEKDQIIQIIRNQKKEEKACLLFSEFDATEISLLPELARLNEQHRHHFLIDHAYSDALSFSIEALPVLRKAGWQIEIADDFPVKLVDEQVEGWFSSIDEESSQDWFTLELGITLNGENINLLPILHKLLQYLQQQRIDINTIETFPVQLPDGRYLQLPKERVRSILNILIELYDQNSLTDDKLLQLSKLQASRLLELEAALKATGLRWFGGEKIRALGERLRDFKGIQTIKPPKQFQAQLRPYQQEGLSWLQFLREYGFGGILADDMGLGKTVQTLAHMTLEKESGRMNAPALVVAPTSLMFNWQAEAKQFSPGLKTLVLHGNERKKHFDELNNYDLILTTYPLLARDKEMLLKHHFYLLVLDEAQFIKNHKTLGAQIAAQLKATHRLCLTGTPMENHLEELWSLFHFLMPGLLGNQHAFARQFRTPIEKHHNAERRTHLNKRITPFLLRRTKDKVVKELPEKIEIIRHAELSSAQRDLYETIRVTMQKKIQKEIAKLGLARSHIMILDALLKLRQICCDPRLLKLEAAKQKTASSAKLKLLMDLVSELLEEDRRILIFSQFTGMLSLIEEALNKRKLAYVKLTGKTRDRATPIQQFQQGEVPIFLISLKAGGTGLNLTAADTVIHYDPWWNPAVEQQASDRAHRIGQTKTVFVYKLVMKDTIEDRILELQKSKKALVQGLLSDNTSKPLKLTEKDLQVLFEGID